MPPLPQGSNPLYNIATPVFLPTMAAKHLRVRTGCFNCRMKHKKCDESKPRCGLCTKRNETCTWPANKSKVTADSFRVMKIHRPNEGEGLKIYSSRLKESLQPLYLPPVSPRLQNLINAELETELMEKTSSLQPNLPENGPENLSQPSKLVTDLSGNVSPNFQDPMPPTANGSISGKLSENLSAENPNTLPALPDSPLLESENSISSSLMAPFWDYSHLHRTFRDYMFTNAVTSSSFKPEDIDFKNILESPAPDFLNFNDLTKNLQDMLQDPLFDTHKSTTSSPKNPETAHRIDRIKLYKTYLYEVAPWLDMFDSTKQFGTAIPHLASNNSILLNAIFAIASRQLEQTLPSYPREKTIKLYEASLKNLIPTVNKTLDVAIISSCLILCVFEMMSSSPKKWRYHLEGCAALFKIYGINGFSNELERGLFWCYARMDVSSAVIGEQPTIIPSNSWLPPDFNIHDLKELFNKFGNKEDMYANYMVYLCSRVLNLIAGGRDDYEKEWKLLWKEIGDWHENRPSELKPIYTFNDSPFPGILYVNGPSISANQLYHMAIILMQQNKPRLHKIVNLDHVKSPIWHARQICAISLHNEHHGCWNNALQPLWIAGQLLSGEQEHEILLELLQKIESTTGWQMNFRAEDLKRHWSDESLIG